MSKLLTATITDLRSCENAVNVLKEAEYHDPTSTTNLYLPPDVFLKIEEELDRAWRLGTPTRRSYITHTGAVYVNGVRILIR